MRITVNLSHFFTDHRSKAKVYVKENMRYIKDLERRISKIFEINGFYLICENHYLPPFEDVRLLNFDDVVWVVPVSENKLSSEQVYNAEMLEETKEIRPIKKKKKSKKKHEAAPTEEVENEKRKIKYKQERRSSNDKIASKEQVESTIEAKSPTTNKIEDSTFKDSGRDSLDSSKSDELSNEATNVNVKSLVDTFENKNIDFKKQIELLNSSTVSDPNKRVNIVKTIIVQHHSLQDCNTSSNKFLKNETAPSSYTNVSDSITERDIKGQESITETPKNKLNGFDSTCSTSRLDTTLENSYSSSLESGDFKRKRKRVRKRKRLNNIPECTSALKKLNLIPRPLIKASNPRHVRFKDVSNEQENDTVIIIDDTIKPEELPEKNPSSEKISVEEPKETIVPKKAIEKELTEDFILKQPVMQNMQPRQGDIVAFKILRISESYTPEISSRIVGKISSYTSPNSEVVFDIIYGQDQCVQPQGKFSLATGEEVTTENNSNHYNCKWSDLLEPRLLFP